MIPSTIPIPLPGGLTVPLPRCLRVRQRFDDAEVADVDAAVAAEFAKFSEVDLVGKSVAVAVGSRGIRSQRPVVVAVIRELKAAGAAPFIVPAMGSHGTGKSEAQKAIVEDYGMGAEEMGVPLRSSLEVVEVARVADDLGIYCDRLAYEADYIVACNRVKPHTSFRGRHESGLAKMLTIGLGKHKGAVEMHRRGMDSFGELLPIAAEAFLANTQVLFAVAIVENGYEKLSHVELVPPSEVIARDAALLERAKILIPRLLFDDIDVLMVDQIGKNISGAGMDPNVTGRNASKGRDFGGPNVHRIVVCDLTEGTQGNATGIGVADVTTQAVLGKMDFAKTYVNVVTAGVPAGGSLPLVADNDRDALFIALRGCPMVTPDTAKVVRIENTLDLGEIWVSTALLPAVEAHPDMEALSAPFDMPFDEAGRLGPLWPQPEHAALAQT